MKKLKYYENIVKKIEKFDKPEYTYRKNYSL